MKTKIFGILFALILVTTLGLIATPALAVSTPIENALTTGADRLVALQGPNSGPYPYNWEWVAGDGNYGNANLQGITATGLLPVYEKTLDTGYLNAARNAGSSLVTRYNGQPDDYDHGPYTQDVEFLVRLSRDTGDTSYAAKAAAYFDRIAANKTAAQLVDYIINNRGSLAGWDLASRIRAAQATGYTTYANDITNEMIRRSADWVDIPLGGTNYTTLSYGSLLWAFRDIGYTGPKIAEYETNLLTTQNSTDGSWGGEDFQTTAYAMLGLAKVGGTGTAASLDNARTFLLTSQASSGSWSDSTGVEYPEVNSEALMALSTYPRITSFTPTIGGNGTVVTITGSGFTGTTDVYLILLDLMLPQMDGLEVCRVLRKEMAVPIIIVTARTEEIDKIVGLEIGADDYVTKPFSMRELLARVHAALRRRSILDGESTKIPQNNPPNLSAGPLTVDLNRHCVTINAQPLELTPKEFDLITFLVKNRGHLFSREALLEKVWGYDYAGDTRTVDVHIRWLREKIEKDPSDPKLIVTIRGYGYKLEPG